MAKFEYIFVDMFVLGHFSFKTLQPCQNASFWSQKSFRKWYTGWQCMNLFSCFIHFFFLLLHPLIRFMLVFFSLPRLDSFLHHHEPRGTQKHDGLMKTSGQLYAICSDNRLDLRRGPLVLLEWCGVRLKITREAARQILIYLFICVVCLALRAGGPPK